jgi:hypothetical protein
MKDTSNDQAYIWKPKALDWIFLFKAQFKRFTYNKHTHREFAVTEYTKSIAGTPEENLDVDAFIIYGPKKKVNKITGNLPVLR